MRAEFPRREGRHGPRERAHGLRAAAAAVHGRAGPGLQGPGLRRAVHGGPHVRGAVPQLPAAAVRDGLARRAAAPGLPALPAVQVMAGLTARAL